MARDEARQKLTDYISARLTAETKGDDKRGEAAKIARETGFSSAHIANVSNGKLRGVGDDFARAMAKYWEMEFADLLALAEGRAPARRDEVSEDDVHLDPKEQVRRESFYLSAPPAVRYWFDHDDAFTAGKDISKLTVRVYQRRLEAIWADFDAGALAEPGTQLEGSTMQPDEPDPDAPARKR